MGAKRFTKPLDGVLPGAGVEATQRLGHVAEAAHPRQRGRRVVAVPDRLLYVVEADVLEPAAREDASSDARLAQREGVEAVSRLHRATHRATEGDRPLVVLAPLPDQRDQPGMQPQRPRDVG